MSENKKNTLRAIFYILLGMSLAGTIILFVLNQSLPGWFGKTDECTLFSKKLHDVYSLVLKENFVLYLYCFIMLIIASKRKKINAKTVLIIIFAVLTSATAVNFGEDFVDNVRNYFSPKEIEFGPVYKPMLYVYPKEDMDLTIKLKNDNLITYSYPKYNNEWRVHATVDGNLYDYETGRNYYALFWEGIDNNIYDMNEGFIVAGKDTVKFLEDKLSILGLNDKEINEFIVYWLPKMEDNKYNYIRFRTEEEINAYMPIEFSSNPDTLIRVYMDFKVLDKKVNIKEQKLTSVSREGFTVVEWGGRELK